MKNLFIKSLASKFILLLAMLFVGIEFASAIGIPELISTALYAPEFIKDNFLLGEIIGGWASGTTLAFALPSFVNLEHDEENSNMAGISTKAYVIKVDDIETFPTLSGAPANPEDLVTYIGSFVLKAGKFWTTMYSTQELGSLTSENDGPRDGEFSRGSAILFYPHTNKQALGMAKIFQTADVIIIVQEFATGGQFRVLGTELLPARIKISENSGVSFGDQKGITFTGEAPSTDPPLVYEGSIVLETDVVNAPVLLAPDAVEVDLALGDNFVVGLNTGAIVLTTITNSTPGATFFIHYNASSTGSLQYTDPLGASVTLNTDGQWMKLRQNSENEVLIVDRKS